MIATRDRGPELRVTLDLLRRQQYQPIEIVVIDDGSKQPIESVVRALWPDAVVIRQDVSQGMCRTRNTGFAASHGEFILQLDDDCCLTQPGDLEHSVRQLVERPAAGAAIFDLYNGAVLPDDLEPSRAQAGCVKSFVGAAILFRTAAIRQTAGYRTFYDAQGEDGELALQLLSKGWQILFCPTILAHHRLSTLNRNSLNTWRRGLGNDIWSLVMHFPVRRLPMEVGWKLFVGFWDMIRLARYVGFCQGIWRCLIGLSRAWRLRQPFSELALRRFDALRLRSVLMEAEFENPSSVGPADLRGWWSRWRNRARDASLWESGDRGSSNIVRYAHQYGEEATALAPKREDT
jgi:GT2 family glycosyltransferase